MIIEELQNCIWRVASINLGFDGCKCSFTWRRIAASKMDICDGQILNLHQWKTLFKYNTVISILIQD